MTEQKLQSLTLDEVYAIADEQIGTDRTTQGYNGFVCGFLYAKEMFAKDCIVVHTDGLNDEGLESLARVIDKYLDELIE